MLCILGERGIGRVTLQLEKTLVGFSHYDRHTQGLFDIGVVTAHGVRIRKVLCMSRHGFRAGP